jgi:hypothetical protein
MTAFQARYGALLGLLFSASSVLAEDQNIACDAVPAFVRGVFQKTFPTASPVACIRDVEQNKTVAYDISAKNGATNLKASLSPTGQLIGVEETIPLSDVPDPVKQAVAIRYPDGIITTADKITHPALGFEFMVRRGGKILQVAVDPSGRQVKEVKD